MNRSHVFYTCLLFFFVAGFFTAASADEEGGTNLDLSIRSEGPLPSPVHAGQLFEWRIVVRWFENENLTPALSNAPKFTQLTLLSSSTRLTSKTETNRRFMEKTFSFQLKAPAEGEYTIGTAGIEYQDENDQTKYLRTGKTTFTVQPKPFDPYAFFVSIVLHPILIILVTLGILIILCVTFFKGKRKQTMPPVEEIPAIQTSIDSKFQEAKRHRLEGEFSAFAQRLEEAIRLAMEERFPDKKHDILIDYKEEVDTDKQNALQQFVDLSVHIKYAPGTPPPDTLDQLGHLAKTLTQLDTSP